MILTGAAMQTAEELPDVTGKIEFIEIVKGGPTHPFTCGFLGATTGDVYPVIPKGDRPPRNTLMPAMDRRNINGVEYPMIDWAKAVQLITIRRAVKSPGPAKLAFVPEPKIENASMKHNPERATAGPQRKGAM